MVVAMTLGTLLTLLVVPAFYTIFARDLSHSKHLADQARIADAHAAHVASD